MFPTLEWTQKEYLLQKEALNAQGIDVYLIDTVLHPIEGAHSITYNPVELSKTPKGSYFVFYCDTGKSTKERLDEFSAKFTDYHCVSLKGGRGYWRPYLRLESIQKDD